MAVSLTHSTVVVIPDDGTSPVGSDEWNAEHVMTLATGNVLGRTAPGAGAVEEISISSLTSTIESSLGPTFVNVTGDTMTGPLILPAAMPSGANEAAHKTYVDSRVAKAGDTMTGNLTIKMPFPQLILENTGAGQSQTLIGKVAGAPLPKLRWALDLGDGTTESGSNAGSNFAIRRYSDGESLLATALEINRATGAVTVDEDLITNNNLVAKSDTGARLLFRNMAEADKSILYYQPADNSFRIWSSTQEWLFRSDGKFASATGYLSKQGYTGAYGITSFNFYWGGSGLEAWVDSTNVGLVTLTSDYRIKANVVDLPSKWNEVKSLRPVQYNFADYGMFKSDTVERWGFIAHELQETLIQDAATGVKDQENLLQMPNPWTVIAALTTALQEAMTRIEALEAAR